MAGTWLSRSSSCGRDREANRKAGTFSRLIIARTAILGEDLTVVARDDFTRAELDREYGHLQHVLNRAGMQHIIRPFAVGRRDVKTPAELG